MPGFSSRQATWCALPPSMVAALSGLVAFTTNQIIDEASFSFIFLF
jgi:hypothetical protein